MSTAVQKRLEISLIARSLDSRMSTEGLSLRRVAKLLSLSPSTLTRIRQGERPDAETLAVLMDWLSLETKDVLVPMAEGQGAARSPSGRKGSPRRRPSRA
jgi:transcriptional regulator with XRE-family HTH domain